MASLRKSTHTYANHGIPLECDIYDGADYPPNSPVFLFFHSGGLVIGGRLAVPPWLVQTCLKNKWPLVSASYRLMPQTKAQGLLEDVTAAYDFCAHRLPGAAGDRRIIVGGASAGFFMATLTAHHRQPPPLALLCITGIPSFQHPFFSTSIQLTPEPIPRADVERFLDVPALGAEAAVPSSFSVGTLPPEDEHSFDPGMLLPSGAKDPSYVRAVAALGAAAEREMEMRGMLYDYWLYENAWPDLVRDVDPGFEWALGSGGGEADHPQSPSQSQRGPKTLDQWPRTIVIQGDDDPDVDKDVSLHAARYLGPDKAAVYLAKGEPHLFEAAKFLEDEGAAMDVVRNAVRDLEATVAGR